MSRRSRVESTLVGSALVSLLALATPAHAQMLAFDFDTDGVPGTVQSEVEAEIGDLVAANLVLSSVPNSKPWLHAVQFGMSLTDGLELVGLSAPVTGALILQDGLEGLAVAFSSPIFIEDLPVVIMRFTVRVTNADPQSLAVVPSTGWGVPYDEFLLLLSQEAEGETTLYGSPSAIPYQGKGRVNGTVADVPIEASSWSGVKGRYIR